jgi:hypothetical protein
MLRYFFIIVFCNINIYTLFSQVVVNEVIYGSNNILKVELYNNSSSVIKLKSIIVQSEGFEVKKAFKDFEIQPSKLSLIVFRLGNSRPEFNKFFIKINTEDDQFYTRFNGCILKGESAGRYPDFEGEFVIYSSLHISPGVANYSPGKLIKKTSRTKFTPRDSSPNAALYYNNNYWIFGGWDYNYESDTYSSKANVWKSADGIEWEKVNENPPFSHYSSYFVFNNKMMVYESDYVFISEDGITWDQQALNPGFCSEARYTVFKNKAYVFSSNIIGESTDGINWVYSQTDIDSDPERFLPAFVSSEERLWLYGGSGFNDVWTSADGLHWKKLLNHAPWAKRHWFNYTYYDNKIWMIAGNLDATNNNKNFGNLQDFWYSSDGIKWNLLETDKSFYNRHGSFLWNDGEKVLISSGFGNDSPDRMYNDVWELTAKNPNPATYKPAITLGPNNFTYKHGIKPVPTITPDKPGIEQVPDIIPDKPGNLERLNDNLSNKVIFPNPNRGVIKISNIGSFSMRIFDIGGRQIFHNGYPQYYNAFEENLSNVLKTNGIYIITLIDIKTGKTFSQKLDVVH